MRLISFHFSHVATHISRPAAFRRGRLFGLAAAASLAAGLNSGLVQAEPALDRVLSGVQVANAKSCTALNISFNLRVRYISHFPAGQGQELRIMLRPIDGQQAAAEILTRRESIRAPETKFAHVRSIDFEAGNAAGPVLVIQFDEPAHFDVSQGDDFQSLVVKLYGRDAPSTCPVNFQSQGGLGGWSTTVVTEANSGVGFAQAIGRGKGKATESQIRSAAAHMDEGRGALRKHDYSVAIAKFTAVLKLPETESSAEAQELLGVALQKDNQAGRAVAEYEDYVARYPNGDGAERVRQRLAGLATANGVSGAPLHSGRAGSGETGQRPQTWTVSGSASQFYIRDDSFRTLRDPSLPLNVNESLDDHRVHQNELLSSLDLIATWSGEGFKSKFRFSGTEEHGFGTDEREIVGVAALFADLSLRDWGADARIGRQTRNTGGVLGRFDGAVLSYQASPMIRLNAVGGSPVARRRDAPFEDEKAFYGGSIDIGPFLGGFDASLFAIEQRDRSVIDRRAVGAELRYSDGEKSAFGTIDYDIYYEELNAAVLTGSWTLADKSTLFGAFDYRKSPYLSTWTALQGQGFPTLYRMLKVKTLAEIEQLAVDRTASFTSASLGFSRPLNETFQVSADATVTNVEGTIASGGVDAIADTGNEYFYSAQVIGTNVFSAEDLFIAGVRFADLAASNYYVLDLSARYPVMEGLKINPRLRLGYRTGDTTDLEEFSVLPSVLFNYYITRDASLELEVGAQWTDSTEKGVQETTTDVFFTVGYRYDFYADGTLTNQARSAPYGVGVNK